MCDLVVDSDERSLSFIDFSCVLEITYLLPTLSNLVCNFSMRIILSIYDLLTPNSSAKFLYGFLTSHSWLAPLPRTFARSGCSRSCNLTVGKY